MINSINLAPKDNPRWPVGNQPETAIGAGPGGPGPRTGIRDFFSATFAGIGEWLADIPRRAGAAVFGKNDAEAYWRGWQIIPLHGGLSRRYRDRRFDTKGAPKPGYRGTLRPWDPQAPCALRPPTRQAPGIHEDVHEDTDPRGLGAPGDER